MGAALYERHDGDLQPHSGISIGWWPSPACTASDEVDLRARNADCCHRWTSAGSTYGYLGFLQGSRSAGADSDLYLYGCRKRIIAGANAVRYIRSACVDCDDDPLRYAESSSDPGSGNRCPARQLSARIPGA